MRKIIGGMFVSLDGIIQAPGGPTEDPTGGFAHGGWMFPVADDEVGAAIGDFFSRPYDLLLGRRTYNIFAAFWPYVAGEQAAMGEAFTTANKYVLTKGEQSLPWTNSHRMRGMDEVVVLKQGDGPDLLIQGSSTLYPALFAAGLLNRLMLYISRRDRQRQALVRCGYAARHAQAGRSPGIARGTVIATYAPAGPVATGSFSQIASAREGERQQHMKDGTW